MAVVIVTISVANIDSTLQVFDRIKVYRSASQAGPFAEITNAGTRPVLEPNLSVYQYTDLTGGPTFWYQTSFFNQTTSEESEASDPKQGDSGAAQIVITPDELLEFYLAGCDLTDDNGNVVITDNLLEHYIESAVAWFEQRFDLRVRPLQFTESHDFYRDDWKQWGFLRLDEFPIVSIDRISLKPPGASVPIDLDVSKIVKVQKHAGQVNLSFIDASGITMAISGMGYSSLLYQDWIPDFIEVEYTAGFTSLPRNIKDIIGMQAAMGPLNILGDLIAGAGVASQSLSIDGLSQSVSTTSSATNAGYGSRIIQYRKQIEDQAKFLTSYWKGIKEMTI